MIAVNEIIPNLYILQDKDFFVAVKNDEYDCIHNIDYSNKLTRTTSEVSIRLNNYLKAFLTNGFDIFEKLIK